MKNFLKIFRLILPFWKPAAMNLLFNILSVVFGLVSLTMVVPFLGLLFDKVELVTSEPEFALTFNYAIDFFYYQISSIIIEHSKADALMFICIGVVILFFCKNIFRYMGMFFLASARNGVVAKLREEMYEKIISLPMAYYSEKKKGDIMSRMTSDIQEVEVSIMSSLEMVFREPVAIVIYLAAMIAMSLQLSVFVLILLPIAALIIGRVGKSLKRTSAKGQKKMGLLLSIIEETIGGLRIIKAFSAHEWVSRKFQTANHSYRKIMIRMLRKRDLASPMSEFLGAVVLVAVMLYGGSLVLGDNPSVNAEIFIAYIVIFSQVMRPAQAFSAAYFNIQKGIASLERISEVLDAPVTIDDKPDAIRIPEFKSMLEFRDVSFAYQDDEIVLKNISLKIEKGKTIALVGQSGGGKSTMADLIPRLMDVSSGAILVDGNDIRDIKIIDLRKLMGIVSQESILFNDTVFNNIAFGIDNPDPQKVEAAARVANAHEFILQMTNGYQAVIGDRGLKLSGGQRQRLSIARALLKNPPILILDEATSALDTESERLVQDALTNLMKNRTSVVIAHRLSTIVNADEICVVHNGEIVEQGSHEQLLLKKGVYKKLFDLQSFH
ncbi:MAG: ABC transporter ATP-binding protein/permease [Bacteroidetes bacterium]|nr:ABC transporter ATP-binding protein/permease [Bacteroidota bacterium]